ncbi:MAG: hypothetical protein CMG50_04580 [Candidatus Marinimicrobia bacterium]|nr:hypothetical protein [Candidatus Neomarinimicrobiota bacterium]
MGYFQINKEYKKSDIYKILNVPIKRQGGAWLKGHHNYIIGKKHLHFIFANIGTVGYGLNQKIYDYNNYINENGQLVWVTQKDRKQKNIIMKSLLSSSPYIFINTKSTNKGYWLFMGNGIVSNVKGNNPVKIIWDISKKSLWYLSKYDLENEDKKEISIRKNATITGDKAEKIFEVEFLKKGWKIKNKTDDHGLGYDFDCIDNKNNRFFVEIKGCRNDIENIRMTEKEWEVSKIKKSNYLLCVVSNIEASPRFNFYSDPYKLFKEKIVPRQIISTTLHIKKIDLNLLKKIGIS